MSTLTITADDFGLSFAVNEAVEIAYRAGGLTAASLMVGGEAAEDAVRRARRLPGLRVGLHLVVIQGQATLPGWRIPGLANAEGWMDGRPFARGCDYFFRPACRRQLAAEIRAQFAAFAATGLPLGHADAHQHMHLHPTVGRLMIAEGRRHGLTRLRVPAEPPAVLRACGDRPGPGGWALHHWSRLLRAQAHAAGLRTTDHVFGLAWSGRFTAERLRRLLGHLPPGSSEIYLHPATRADALPPWGMPASGDRAAELEALCDPAVRAALALASPGV